MKKVKYFNLASPIQIELFEEFKNPIGWHRLNEFNITKFADNLTVEEMNLLESEMVKDVKHQKVKLYEIKEVPNAPKVILVEAVLMPNGEIIGKGQGKNHAFLQDNMKGVYDWEVENDQNN